jgi:hypothetical protein
MRRWPVAKVIENCDVCDGRFDTTTDPRVLCESDMPLADHDFEPQKYDNTVCEVDGWAKYEHDLRRPLNVHESCFLDKDDELVRL